MTKVTISVSKLHTFRSWATIFYLSYSHGVFIPLLIRYARAMTYTVIFFNIYEVCQYLNMTIPYIGIFSRRAILAKMTIERCVNCLLSPIFAIWRAVNGNLMQCRFCAISVLVIWKMSPIQRKLNQREKIRHRGIKWHPPTIRHLNNFMVLLLNMNFLQNPTDSVLQK